MRRWAAGAEVEPQFLLPVVCDAKAALEILLPPELIFLIIKMEFDKVNNR